MASGLLSGYYSNTTAACVKTYKQNTIQLVLLHGQKIVRFTKTNPEPYKPSNIEISKDDLPTLIAQISGNLYEIQVTPKSDLVPSLLKPGVNITRSHPDFYDYAFQLECGVKTRLENNKWGYFIHLHQPVELPAEIKKQRGLELWTGPTITWSPSVAREILRLLTEIEYGD